MIAANKTHDQTATETYQRTRRVIRQIVYTSTPCPWCHPDERFSIANEAYTRAYNTYDHTRKAKFTTYVYRCIRNDLIRGCQQCHRRRNKHWYSPSFEGIEDKKYPGLYTILGSLSKDAQTVVSLVLECPAELRRTLIHSKNKSYVLEKRLKNLGWTFNRIWESLFEIRRALK